MTLTALPSRESVGNALILSILFAAAVGLLFVQSAGTVEWRDPGTERLGIAGLSLVLYAGLCAAIAYHRRRRSSPAAVQDASLLVVHASQSGVAEQLAHRTAAALAHAGQIPPVLSLGELDAGRLAGSRRILFLASTTGEGDPPDSAIRFMREVMSRALPLPTLEYGLLALGDREYQEFCRFGRTLDQWLQQQGATPLFARIEVDGDDAEALTRWQHCLNTLGADATVDWEESPFLPWRLQQRTHLNPGSQGGPVYHLQLALPTTPAIDWQPGDIAVVQPRLATASIQRWLSAMGVEPQPSLLTALSSCQLPAPDSPAAAALHVHAAEDWATQLATLPPREYSIASLPGDGSLDLVIRQMPAPDGHLGIGSGWLTQHAEVGATLDCRLRSNPSFHPPADDRPMILIGNGTGIAGLRAHLRLRERRGHHRNWLLFGERSAQHDGLFSDELRNWQAHGVLQRLDLVFSRDQTARRYVQHQLSEAGDVLRRWIDDGAGLYVCGSREGMAPGVHAALTAVLGLDTLDTLMAQGRYRRDIY